MFPPPSAEIAAACHHAWLYTGAVYLNSWSHALRVYALPIKTFPCPPELSLNVSRIQITESLRCLHINCRSYKGVFFSCECVCTFMYVQVDIHMYVHTHMHVCGGQRMTSGVMLRNIIHLHWGKVSHWSRTCQLGPTDSPVNPRDPLSYLLSVGLTSTWYHSFVFFYMDFGDWTQVFMLVRQASTLSTELFPQSHKRFFFKSLFFSLIWNSLFFQLYLNLSILPWNWKFVSSRHSQVWHISWHYVFV